jgi:hypothetical protein
MQKLFSSLLSHLAQLKNTLLFHLDAGERKFGTLQKAIFVSHYCMGQRGL